MIPKRFWNPATLVVGSSQIQLSEDAIIITSPLKRAIETKDIVFGNDIPFGIDFEFSEIGFGIYENKVVHQEDIPECYRDYMSTLHEYTHGDDMAFRADRAILKILQNQTLAEDVCVFTHVWLARAIVCRLKGESINNIGQYHGFVRNGGFVTIERPAVRFTYN